MTIQTCFSQKNCSVPNWKFISTFLPYILSDGVADIERVQEMWCAQHCLIWYTLIAAGKQDFCAVSCIQVIIVTKGLILQGVCLNWQRPTLNIPAKAHCSGFQSYAVFYYMCSFKNSLRVPYFFCIQGNSCFLFVFSAVLLNLWTSVIWAVLKFPQLFIIWVVSGEKLQL